MSLPKHETGGDTGRPADERTRATLAPQGVLRVGLNVANFLLVLGDDANGEPRGIAPDVARDVARRLDVEAAFVRYELPGPLADALQKNEVDLGFLAIDSTRAEHMDFASAYLEIDASYMAVGNGSINTLADVDQPRVRIAVIDRSAYDLWLTRNIRKATLIRAENLEASYRLFSERKADVVAGLTQGLLLAVGKYPDARLIDEPFSSVEQSMAVPRGRGEVLAWLNRAVVEIKASGLVSESIRRHGVGGVRVAP